MSNAVRYILLAATIAVCAPGDASPASAEVRIGNDVRVGGNPIEPQTFDEKRRGHYIIRKDGPKKPSCTWRFNPDGSKTKTCILRPVKPQ